MKDLAIFAGRGELPRLIHARYPQSLTVIFDGVGVDYRPDHVLRTCFERSGSMLRALKGRGISKICFAGAVTRPALKAWKLDFSTLLMLPQIKKAIAHSDGNALNIIRDLVEKRGFEILAAHELLPEIVVEEGLICGSLIPDPVDLDLAKRVHAEMSKTDTGQALVMRGGACIAREGRAGTASMLADVAAISAKDDVLGGYLFKASKLGQDLALDMATIGPDTIDQVVKARLDGIILGAGITQFLEREILVEKARRMGIFIMGVRL